MSRYNIKIKSTGFGFFPFFLPVFLAAFVEQDEKSMNKAKIFEQKAVLSAGTFSNLITALIATGAMILFFTTCFTASGVVFNDYAMGIVGIGNISSINNISLDNPSYTEIFELTDNNLTKIKIENQTYFITKELLTLQKNNQEFMIVYLDSPAINSNLKGVILKINGQKIKSLDDLSQEMDKYSIGETIQITTTEGDYNIQLKEHPLEENKNWIGINFNSYEKKGIISKVFGFFTSFKKPNVYYESKFKGGDFIYDFFWWLALISFSVALVNMLPMGIFDGGRFFYLTILGLTNSKRKAENFFKNITKFLLILVLILMIFWAISFI